MKYRGVIIDEATQEAVDTSKWMDSNNNARAWLKDQLSGFGPHCGLKATIQRSTQSDDFIFIIDENGFVIDAESRHGLPVSLLKNGLGQVTGIRIYATTNVTWEYDETMDSSDLLNEGDVDPEVMA